MMKIKVIATFIALFAFIFTFLHATPIPRSSSSLNPAVAILEKINGVFTLDQIAPDSSAAFGIIFKGIHENSPENYFISIGDEFKESFKKLAITIDPHKAGPWNVTGPGNVTALVGQKFAVLKNDKVLDSTMVERYA
ncbi:hypothetical protein C2G38_2030287 [Gigaspora rosea]|uniref:Uncharacterized protein n=1 Tax=Gigaspora rosea TaxID=44941 RepID=A0A397VUW1_9GLOM|nr:hypothetical protein C2G38_2030287 [Gigaspora rosea]CAG8552010.1 4195_t:CDS:1 [Gigaspora rosea]